MLFILTGKSKNNKYFIALEKNFVIDHFAEDFVFTLPVGYFSIEKDEIKLGYKIYSYLSSIGYLEDKDLIFSLKETDNLDISYNLPDGTLYINIFRPKIRMRLYYNLINSKTLLELYDFLKSL